MRRPLFTLFLSVLCSLTFFSGAALAHNIKRGLSRGEHVVMGARVGARAEAASYNPITLQVAGVSENGGTSTVTYGSAITLNWSATESGSCFARSHAGSDQLIAGEAGGWSGPKAASGSETVSGLTAPTYTYLLQCESESTGQYSTREVSVYVGPAGAPVPDNPSFYLQWGLFNRGSIFTSLAPLLETAIPNASIDAPEGWAVNTNGSGKIVAVVDTGIDYEHPDLAANIWTNPHPTQGDLHGYNFYVHNGDPIDEDGHGTNVAGIIGAVANSGVGTSGVAWKAQIMSVKVMGGKEGSFTTTSEYEGVHYAVEHGASIINASYGGTESDEQAESAYRYAASHNALVVAAAGNEGVDIDPNNGEFYPCAYDRVLPNVICVGANSPNGEISAFSNYGAKTVDLFAPGGFIYSTVPPFVSSSGYAFYDGTSMAAPFVSGAASLYWTYYPTATAEQVKAAILASVERTPEMEEKSISGGHLDIGKLMHTPPPPVPAALSRPRVAGNAVLRHVLTCRRGTWSAAPTHYSYSWRRGSRVIHNGPSYRVRKADIGRRIGCVVTASNAVGSVSVTSSNTLKGRR